MKKSFTALQFTDEILNGQLHFLCSEIAYFFYNMYLISKVMTFIKSQIGNVVCCSLDFAS